MNAVVLSHRSAHDRLSEASRQLILMSLNIHIELHDGRFSSSQLAEVRKQTDASLISSSSSNKLIEETVHRCRLLLPPDQRISRDTTIDDPFVSTGGHIEKFSDTRGHFTSLSPRSNDSDAVAVVQSVSRRCLASGARDRFEHVQQMSHSTVSPSHLLPPHASNP